MSQLKQADRRWYAGITRYQWLVFLIACLGWAFDTFEGQIFAVFKSPAMADLLGVAENAPSVDWFSNAGFASFLIGGAFGGVVFGILADRIGRRQSMVWSILTYSIFTGLHYFAWTPWQIVALRFLVAMGVAGEWAIAASFVAEVFPKKARAMAGGIFHASGVLGAVFAAGIGMFLDQATDWRPAFLVGLLPGLLVVWVLVSLKESEKWEATRASAKEGAKPQPKGGSLRELLGAGPWRRRALLGLGLASVGLGTYWGIYAWGPELVHEVLRPTRTTSFWRTENAQELIRSFHDGPNDTHLSSWMANNFAHTYGSSAGTGDLTGKTNEQVAAYCQTLCPRDDQIPLTPQADVLGMTLAVYATSENLAGNAGADYGFLVTSQGIGTNKFNVGRHGAAFGATDDSEITVLTALRATDAPATVGLLDQLDNPAIRPANHREDGAGTFDASVYTGVIAQVARARA